ncbi:hypothetical protein LAZ67_21000550 [Cordylochernes scorpioides]|uniref:Reverse transcriptase n=1 Tax=Cordylochernes scorpioides TaxID=51811 RepID=A0ABY6LQN3_9ARAC|nr:hypothetical protein LAZ67_21000550 [Cordylochernes scorpioides]
MKLEELREKNIPASDDLVYTFNQRILEAMSSAKITYSIKGGPRKSKPWFDKDCYDMKKLAKESLKKYRKTNRLEDRECYASSRKKYLALLDLKRKGFDNEKQEILRNAKDSKTFWKTIALYKSTSIIQGEISIQDWLNFYRELMTTEKNLRICNLHNVISQNDPILDSEITNADIYKEIAGLRSNKACGPDGIPNEVLKTLPDSYILLLKQLYNSVMTTGKYPAIWTNSTIHPIFKNGYKNSPSNYRDLPSVNLPEFGDIHLLLYADDIAIIGESRINLQKKIKILKEYLDENLMTLNESKSKIMVFRNGDDERIFLDAPYLQAQEVLEDTGLGRRQDGQGVVLQVKPEDPSLQVRGPLDDSEGLQDDRPDPPTGPVAYQAMVGSDSLYCKYTTCLHSAVRPRVARAPECFASGGRKVSRMATNFIRAESPSKAEQKPVRHGSLAQPCAELSANQDLQNEIPIVLRKNQNYVNPPAGGQDANSAAPVDLAAIPTSNAAAQVRRNWADITEEVNPGAEEGFTLVQGRKRRRGSANSPTAAAPSSNPGGSRTIRRPQPSAGSVPRAQEIRVTRAHIAEARARQASSSEEHCVYIEHSPELEPFHYLRALDRMLGGTAGVIQITKVNGHQLLGLTNRGLAERLISEGLEVEGTLLRAFPFRKRAERITVGNLPFFVADSAVITALSPYGRVTSIAPKQMKAGPYVYVDGRRDVFITLHEGITIERLPTRLDINIKGQAWPAYLSSGIRCSRCHGQGHRRAICPLLAGLANNTRTAPPTTPAGVPPPTTPAPPQRSAAQPPAPTPSNPAMEVCSAPPVARAALHSSAPRPSPPAAPAFPMEETPPAPPPVTPAPSLQTPGSREPAAPTPDVEMSIVEETFASSTVSFAKTDALGLGREEVLDLLSSRTKAQRKGPLLSPPQCDALVGLIGQILDLKPGHTSNLYKVLGQVKAELRTTPAVPPTPTLPAPWPAKPTPPALHGEKTSPDIATPPPPLSTEFIDACYDQANDIIYELSDERYLETLSDIGVTEGDIVEAIIFPDDREPLLRRLSTQKRTTLAGIVSAASERARSSDPFVREGLRILSEMLPPPPNL